MELLLVMDDPDRKHRLVLLLAWRTLRQSVARGRPVTLPNLLRLHRRLCSNQDIPVSNHHQESLRLGYFTHQPFHRRQIR